MVESTVKRVYCRPADEREAVQKKTFTKWVNSHLARMSCRITDLYMDLRDGRMLIKLLEVLSGEKLVSVTDDVIGRGRGQCPYLGVCYYAFILGLWVKSVTQITGSGGFAFTQAVNHVRHLIAWNGSFRQKENRLLNSSRRSALFWSSAYRNTDGNRVESAIRSKQTNITESVKNMSSSYFTTK